jgi:hypothetical protein
MRLNIDATDGLRKELMGKHVFVGREKCLNI